MRWKWPRKISNVVQPFWQLEKACGRKKIKLLAQLRLFPNRTNERVMRPKHQKSTNPWLVKQVQAISGLTRSNNELWICKSQQKSGKNLNAKPIFFFFFFVWTRNRHCLVPSYLMCNGPVTKVLPACPSAGNYLDCQMLAVIIIAE